MVTTQYDYGATVAYRVDKIDRLFTVIFKQ